MKIYLTGQNNFGNRGCEALVRSTVSAIRSRWADAEFLVPSLRPELDAAQWPELSAHGVSLVDAPRVPMVLAKWGGACQHIPMLSRGPWPALRKDSRDAELVAQADLMLSIGGDNYSLDYGVSSLAYFVSVASLAQAAGKPVVLWGASVGPFHRNRGVEAKMATHLRTLEMLTVRESYSVEYLKTIDVRSNVVSVMDTAFLLEPQACGLEHFWPKGSADGVVGVNMSWLVKQIRDAGSTGSDVVDETIGFIETVLSETSMSVLLVPHVIPKDGSVVNNDHHINLRILRGVRGDHGGRLAIVPPELNAAQLKYVIGRCRFLLAARTHATIAGFSQAVPTISIAYSVKARGINFDLFGGEQYLLPSESVTSRSLWDSLRRLLADEDTLRSHYQLHGPAWRTKALAGVAALAACVGG